MNEAQLPTQGHCCLGACRPRPNNFPDESAAMAKGIPSVDFAAPNTKDETVARRVRFSYVSEEDFTLMLEVDMAFVDWLRKRNFLL